MKRLPNNSETRPAIGLRPDRFIPLKVRQTRFHMHEEILCYASSRNVFPKTDFQILPQLLIETILSETTVGHKSHVLKMRESLLQRPPITPKALSKKHFGYNTQSICDLAAEETTINSNARIMDYSTQNVLYLAFGNSVYGYDYTQNRTQDVLTTKSKIYSIAVNHFSDNLIGLALKNGKCELADVKDQRSLRTFENLSNDDKIMTLDWSSRALINGTTKGNLLIRDCRSKTSEALKFSIGQSRVSCVKSNFHDENYVAWSDLEGRVGLTDMRIGNVITFNQHVNCVRSLAWSNLNRTMFASGGKYDGKIIQWTTSCSEVQSCASTGSSVYNVDYTQEGNLIASLGRPENEMRMFEPVQLKPIVIFKGHENPIYHLVLNAQRNLAVSCSQEGKIKFWDLKNQLESTSNVVGIKDGMSRSN